MQRKLAKDIVPQTRTVESAINDWKEDRRQTGTCKEPTLDQQATRVRFMLCDHLQEELTRITSKKAELLYEKHRTRPGKLGSPLAAATHVFDLKCAKNFFKWCVSRRFLVASPFAEIRPIGRKKAGKPQLRIEEAKRFTDAGLQHFETTKNPLAVAALVAITMGPRASEVLNRSVRDLDNGGKILVIDSGKNERAKRRLDVPLFLQPILLGLAQGREPLAKLGNLPLARRDLERLRQPKEADIVFTTQGNISEQMVAPLLFVPFLENSFKHGLNHHVQGGGFVRLNLHVSGDDLEFFIENSKAERLPRQDHPRSGGIGLANVRQRLEMLYPENHTLTVQDEPHRYAVTLHLKMI